MVLFYVNSSEEAAAVDGYKSVFGTLKNGTLICSIQAKINTNNKYIIIAFIQRITLSGRASGTSWPSPSTRRAARRPGSRPRADRPGRHALPGLPLGSGWGCLPCSGLR